MLAREVEWGPVDALKRDDLFSAKWVQPASIQTCLENDTWIVSGEKGSGKSAIVKTLYTRAMETNYIVIDVNFNDVSFRTIYNNIFEFSNTTGIPALHTMSSAWQFALLHQVIHACAVKNERAYGDLKNDTRRSPKKTTVPKTLIDVLSETWNLLDRFTTGAGSVPTVHRAANLLASGGLTGSQIESLRDRPFTEDFLERRERLFDRLSDHNHKVTIFIDNLDRIKNEHADPDVYNVIFAGLIDAILSISTYPDLPTGFSIKAVIPHDRFLGANLRDTDKLVGVHSAIKWDREALESFVGRRIDLAANSTGTFPNLWYQIFPEFVHNTKCDAIEKSFDYILRHTMYRPRHLQTHLIRISQECGNNNATADRIKRAVAGASAELASFWMKEYAIDFPYIEHIKQLFFRQPNIMRYDELVRRAYAFHRQAVLDPESRDPKETVESLYKMGLFGVIRDNIRRGSDGALPTYTKGRARPRPYAVDFYFKGVGKDILRGLEDQARVALHPIFNEAFELDTSDDIVVG